MFECVCADYDGDGPDVFTERLLVARKEHECCECHEPIEPGQQYERVTGLWEGSWGTFKTCMLCRTVSRDFMSCGRTFGYLWQDLHDYLDPAGEGWLQ